MTYRKKLIEVSLPFEAFNKDSVHEINLAWTSEYIAPVVGMLLICCLPLDLIMAD